MGIIFNWLFIGVLVFANNNAFSLNLKLDSIEKKYIVDFLKEKEMSQPTAQSQKNKYNLPSFKIDESKFYTITPFDMSKIDKKRFKEATLEIEQRLKNEEVNLPLVYDHLDPQEKIIAESIRNVSIIGLVTFATMWALPQGVTNWDKDITISEAFDNRDENINSGPVVDKDSLLFNLIGHPLSGAYEYLFLRNKGFSKIESFGFSVFISTFIWEYGIEAIMEVPSIQDLLITPIIGSLLGEVFYQWDQKIKDKDYVLLGSKKFGRIVHNILNPVEGINNGLNKFIALKFLHLKDINLFVAQNQGYSDEYIEDNSIDVKSIGLKFIFEF